MSKQRFSHCFGAIVRCGVVAVVVACCLTLPNFATAADWENTDPSGGGWDVGTNWSTGNPLDNTVCEPGECVEGDAYIKNGGTANIDNVTDFAQHGRRIEISDGTVNQLAGNLFPTSWIDVGTVAGKTGHYNLSAGATLIVTAGNLRVGVDDFGNDAVGPGETGGGNGVFTTSGTATFSNEIIVGFNGPGTGTLNVNGGRLEGSVIKAGFQGEGTGIINQTAGTVTATRWVDIASDTSPPSGSPNTTGTYNLSGGTLISQHSGGGDGVIVGNAGTGAFNQSGGQLDANLDLRLGHGVGGNGTYTQTDGVANVGRRLRIGQNNGGTGEYNLAGGTLNIVKIPGSPGEPEWIEVGGSEGAGLPPFGSPKSSGVGTFNISGGTINNPGALNIGIQGTGTVTQTGGTVNTGFGAPNNPAGGNISLANDGGTGTYNLEGGVLNASDKIIEAGFAGADFNFTGGTLMNVGKFAATLEQQGGTLAPGASPGTMEIDLDYLLSAGTYQVEIDTSGNDLLQVGINADLDADSNETDTTLAIELLGGLSPTVGESFTVITAGNGGDMLGTVAGRFAAIDTSLAALDAGLSWDVIYNAQSVVLEVIAGGGFEPEDLNQDGFVDGLDLGILLGNWNQNGIPALGGEFNGSDPVDGLDLGILLGAWNPSSLSAVSTVPEPTSGVLLLLILGFGLIYRGSNRS